MFHGIIGVIGGSHCSKEIYKLAYKVGKEIAEKGCILVCGGLYGVMEAASKGAYEAGGLTVGILPGKDKKEANSYIKIPVVTSMSHARNAIIARTADVVIAVDGKYGTLSEISLTFCLGKKVVGLATHYNIPGIIEAKNPQEAVCLALKSLKNK